MARDASQVKHEEQRREALAVTLKGALLRRGLTGQEVALEVGVSAATMSAWLNGQTEVPTAALPALARLSNLSANLLYELGGHMPGPGRAASFQDHAALEFRRAVGDLRRWVDRWSLAAEQTPASRVAGSILTHAPHLEVTMRTWFRGTRDRDHHATWLAVKSTRGDTVTLRSLPEAVLSVMAETGTTARGDRPVEGWERPRGLVLFSPQHERTRPPGLIPREAGPSCIVVVGVPYAHAETVAGYVADGLGYGYANAAVVAQERFGRTRDDEDRGAAAQGRVINDWLQRIEDQTLNRYVLTWSDLAPMEATVDALVASSARVIHVKAGKRLLTLGSRVWGIAVKELAREQAMLVDRLAERGAGLHTETYSMRPRAAHALADRGAFPDADDVWDGAVQCSRSVLSDLQKAYAF